MASLLHQEALTALLVDLPGVKAEVYESAEVIGVKARAILRGGPYSGGHSRIKIVPDSAELSPGGAFKQDRWVLLEDERHGDSPGNAYAIEYGFGKGDDGQYLYAGAVANAPLRRAIGEKATNKSKARGNVRKRRPNPYSRKYVLG